jgi:hypothetical protein
MTTSNVQAEYDARFNDAIGKRAAAREKLRDTQATIARLKADAAQASADVAKLRADAKAAGVKLPKTVATNGHTNGAPVVHDDGPEPDDSDD